MDFYNKSSEDFCMYGRDMNFNELIKKENAAKILCGGQLSDCYFLSEMIDSLLTDVYRELKELKFFRQVPKQKAKLAWSQIKNHSSDIMATTDIRYAREISDNIQELIRVDLWKLINSMIMELDYHHVKHSRVLAYILLIDAMGNLSCNHYDDTIKCMKDFYAPVNYDSWYCHVRPTDFCHNWKFLIQAACDYCIPKGSNINLDDSINITNGIKIIIKKLTDSISRDDITKEAMELYGEDIDKKNRDALKEACEMFGIENNI